MKNNPRVTGATFALAFALVMLVPLPTYAQPSYFVPPQEFLRIPASWAGSVQWAQHVTGVSLAGGGAAVGTVGAAAAAPVALGTVAVGVWGYVGWQVWDGWGAQAWDAFTWDDQPPEGVGMVEAPGKWPGTSWTLTANGLRCNNSTTWCFGAQWTVTQEAVDAAIAAGFGDTDGSDWFAACRQADADPSDNWAPMMTMLNAPATASASYYTCNPQDDGDPNPIDVTTAEVAFYPEGATPEPAWTQGTEDRKFKATAECVNVSDASQPWGATKTVTAETDAYSVEDGVLPSMPGIDCGTGWILDRLDVDQLPSDGATLDPTEAWEYELPDEFWTEDPEFEECTGGKEPCSVGLWQISSSGTATDCNTGDVVCEDWTLDPNRDIKYECRWVTPDLATFYVLPLSDCFFLERAFNPDSAGELEPDPSKDVEVPPAPGTANNPLHVDDGCDFGVGDIVNPFSGLAKGVACALEWAFVPSPETQATLDDLGTQLGTKAPFGYIAGAAGWLDEFADVGEVCWTESATIPGYADLEVINTCAGDGVWAWFRSHRTLNGVLLYGAFIVGLGWWGWKAYAPGTIQGG